MSVCICSTAISEDSEAELTVQRLKQKNNYIYTHIQRMDNEFKLNNGSGSICCEGCGRQDNKLNTYDWLADVPGNHNDQDYVEVQFKNTRKGYYRNSNKLDLIKGDIVAVEATPGHDIGTVTLTGRLVLLQMKKTGVRNESDIKRVYRKVKPVDLEKYEEAKSREHQTMIKSRKIAEDLGLQMKIGDVEYQGDCNKAIFYYIADERVDFRQLIKVLAENFRVRIEMKQIGARQEAGRIGGIGPCGRELCCSSWMSNFISVSTSAARYQDISLNPQKLAGQCAKLKCCLNYEVDAYVECQKRLPSKEITLLTKDAEYFYFKADILGGKITYSTDKNFLANEVTLSTKRAFEVINMNRRGEKPDTLNYLSATKQDDKPKDLLEQESLTRFDKSKSSKNKRRKQNKLNNGQQQQNKQQNGQPSADNASANGHQQGDKPQSGKATRQNRNERKDRAERKEKTERSERNDKQVRQPQDKAERPDKQPQQPKERQNNQRNRDRKDRPRDNAQRNRTANGENNTEKKNDIQA